MLWKNNNILSLIVVALTTMATGMNAQSTSDYSDGVFFVNEDWYGHQNSTVNFLTNDGEWIYRVFQKENPDNQLGCTNQYGQIYGDRFYLVAKQEKDPGASVAGGRFTVADAKSMKMICQLQTIDPDGGVADGRGCVGVDETKVYISTSNGIWIFDTESLQVTGKVEGSDNPYASDDDNGGNTNPSNPNLYYGQVGSMVRVGDYVFAVHQSAGILVIDPKIDKVKKVIAIPAFIDEFNTYLDESEQLDNDDKPAVGSSIVMSKDGNVWVSVARNESGSGVTLPFLIKTNPHTLESSVVYIDPNMGLYPPANSWYAWTPDGFCASNVENVLYWNGGNNSWFSNYMIFKYDIDGNETQMIINLDTADDEGWKLYGCSMRSHPVTGDLYLSLFHNFGDPTYIVRKYDADGNYLAESPMIQNYWFPSLPVFPDNEAPIVSSPDDVTIESDSPVEVPLGDIATDADNMDAAIVKTVKAVSDETVLKAEIVADKLVITPLKNGDAVVTLGINSNGKLAEATVGVTVDIETGIGSVETSPAGVDIYDLNGMKKSSMKRGINIIRRADGTTVKLTVNK